MINRFIIDTFALWLGVTPDLTSFRDVSKSQLLSALFLAPVIEEVVFRNHLRLDKKQFYTASIIPLAVAIVFDLGSLFIGIAILSGIVILIFANRTIPYLRAKIPFLILFTATSLMFAFMHIQAVEHQQPYIRILVVFLAFFPLSCLLGIIRLKHGLITAMLFHSAANLLTIYLNGF